MDPNIRNINVVHLHSKLISIEMCLSDNNCLLNILRFRCVDPG